MTRTLAVLAVLALVSVAAGAARPVEAAEVRSVTAEDLAPRAAISSPAAPTAWCGTAWSTDRAPNVVAGNVIRWIYVIPSDGPDNLSTLGSVMQDDAEQIDAWWRREDPARAPRNDLASFPCGTQLDITTLRTSRSSAELAVFDSRFALIADAIDTAGLDSSFVKTLVYYDGPTDQANVCGQGGGNPTGYGLAVVYYRSCVGVSTAAVAAHEYLHTVDAVPSRAPNECDGERAGHVCDDTRDIMYPSIGSRPLSEKLLDLDRDDYYGHAGTWTDTRDSAWLVRIDQQSPLSVMVTGPGAVSSSVPGLLCSATCTTTWNTGQTLALSATPSAGAKLVRWSGSCAGSGGCVVTVGSGSAVAAQFAPVTYRLSVSVGGRGSVRSAPGGTCRSRCSASVQSFTPVRLTATPAKGWKLRSWSGACRGSKRTCTVPMSAATSARATFVRQ